LSLNDQDWLDTINISGVPADYANAGEYISHIRTTLHAAYPTATIAQMVNTQAFTTFNELQRPVADFFAQATTFDIASQRVEDFTDIIADVAPGQTVEVRDTLQTMQRVFQISPTPAAMTQLLSAGIRSSFQVAIMPQAAFVKQFATTLGGEDLALSVHNRASYISMQTLNTVITSREYNDMNLPAGIAIDNKTALGATIKHIPNYETLFGNTSLCECRDCRSVNSPAAYLVDLLRFLDNLKKNSAGKTPYDVLEHRRPDLIHLQLTCENTNTVIPYIDLVNEVLEYYVANTKLDANAIHDNSTETPAELRANPHYVSLDAYKKLAIAVFPFTLPYHQPLDTLRAFLPAKLTRAGLMHDFGMQGAAVVAEGLGLSEREYAILSQETFDASPYLTGLWTFYGYADADADAAAAMRLSLPNVPELLNRTGIGYRDLVALLKTRFLNPGQIPLDIVDDIFKTPVATGQPAQFDSQQVYDILRDIHDDLLLPDDNRAVKDALNRHRIINTTDFVTWIKTNFAAINSTVLLFEPKSHSLKILETER
jgi:hypothetical protein